MDLDAAKRLKLYECILRRYQPLISEKETISISELRHRISPYTDFIRALRTRLLNEIQVYDKTQFHLGLDRVLRYIRSIHPIQFSFTFWLTFEEIDSIKAAPVLDRTLLLASLLRSLEADNVKVFLTRSNKSYVHFEWKGERYLIDGLSTSLLRGEDVQKPFANDPAASAFSDLFFESYEEE